MTALTPKERAISMSRGGLSNDVISGVLGISLADVEALMVQADPGVTLPGGGEVQVAQAVLGHDDILALRDTPFPLIDPPAPGTLHVAVAALLRMGKWNGAAWASPTSYGGFDSAAQLMFEDDENNETVLTTLRQDAAFFTCHPSYLFGSNQRFALMQALAVASGSTPGDEFAVETFGEVFSSGFAGTLQLRLYNQLATLTGGDAANRLVVTVMYVAVNDIPT